MMRQSGKFSLTINGRATLFIALAFAVVILVMGIGAPAWAASSPYSGRITTDPLTGVALDGYDVVSYFTEDAPTLGVSEYEVYFEGVPWYFATQANRDVFESSPGDYIPMFGGFGTTSLSRGFLSEGNPRIYTVLADKLFVFYSTGNRNAFLLAPRPAFVKAQENWLVLREQLVSR